MSVENQTVSLVWMQTLTGAVEVRKTGIPIRDGLRELQAEQAMPQGAGCVVFLLPEQEPMYGAWRVLFERRRQVEDEGYTAENDAEYVDGELASAAIAYLLANLDTPPSREFQPRAFWRWYPTEFKPMTPLRDLERAGALIAAEIDRRMAAGER